MQNDPKTIHRPHADTTHLNKHGLTSLPVLSVNAFTDCYEQASHQLFLASKDLKVHSARTITQSLSLNIINEIDINREFKRHEAGEIVEIELLNRLTGQCEDNLRSRCMSQDYHVDLDIEDGQCVLTGYHIHEINIDTATLSIEERALIYSSFELVSRYQLPLMPPNWYLSATHSLIGEIVDSREFEQLTTQAMKYDCLDELIEFIRDSDKFEYLDYFLEQMGGCLATCVTAILDYERMQSDMTTIEALMVSWGLNRQDCDSVDAQVKKHVERLEKCYSPESKTLLLVLNQLVDSTLYKEFNRMELEDCQPLDFSVTIIDAPYSALIVHLQEQMFDELNQVGEPLREAISFDRSTVARFDLLTEAFRALNELNNGRQYER